MLRVNRAAEMNNVIPGWELAGRPAGERDGGTVATLPSPRPASDGENGHDGGQRDWPVDPRDNTAVARLTRELVAEVEERLGGMPNPPDRPISLADLLAARDAINRAEHNDPDANRAIPVPDHIAGPILGLLSDRGDTGTEDDDAA